MKKHENLETKNHMWVGIRGSEYVGLDILGQSNEDKTVSQKTD